MMRVPGVVTALVNSIDDPTGEGRIQVRFASLPDQTVSAWAPVASLLAGPSRGAFFSPEIDDEVLVAFEHGDFNFPYVIGYLWNGVDLPPETDRKNRVFVTPGGHTLRFEDGDPKKVVIGSAGGHTITLDDNPTSKKIEIVSSAGQSIKIDDLQSSIEMQGGGRILALKAGQVQIS